MRIPPRKQPYPHNCACQNCGKTFYRGLKWQAKENYCSAECKRRHRNIDRECKCCGGKFTIPRSALSGKTNKSGNFCSRGCYEKWLCKTDRVTDRGTQWKRIRDEVMRSAPFCAVCGTTKKHRLQVHHIVPFRLCRSNDKKNLIPLCVKCHKVIETIVHGVEHGDGDLARMFAFFSGVLRERQLLTFLMLSGLKNES